MTEPFEQLADRYLRGEITTAEADELATILERDESLAERLRANLVVDGLLREASRVPTIPTGPVRAMATRRIRRPYRLALLAVAIGSALCLLAGLGVLLFRNQWATDQGSSFDMDREIARRFEDLSVTGGPVATIVRLDNVVWKENSPAYAQGDMVSPGWLRVAQGKVCLEFFCGASVILEGPADFLFVSRDAAWCSEGKIMANVPPQAVGFTINIPQMTVIDRGTEYALQVAAEQSEVHVLKGEVELDQLPGGLRLLEAGTGMAVGNGGICRPVSVSGTGKQSVADLMNDNVVSETRERVEQWRQAVGKISADPKTLLRFDMKPSSHSFRVIPNLATAADQRPADGTRVSCSTGTGSLSCNTSLEFRRVSDRVRLLVPNELDSFTLFARLRLDALPMAGNSILMTDGTRARGLAWKFTGSDCLRLDVYDGESEQTFHYDAACPGLNKQLGRWMTVACVVDRDAGEIRHYINGRLLGQERLRHSFPIQIGMAELGNWNHPGDVPDTDCPLHGAVDELVISTRPWTPGEMQY